MGPTSKVKKAAAKEQLAIYCREVYDVDRLEIVPATERSTGQKGLERSPGGLLPHNACFKIL